jgi:ATP-dependent helicase HrpB
VTVPPLPVDAHIDNVRAALAGHRAAVLTASPGAGKTTRVPPALIDRGRVLLLQPRRVAARAMAQRIADEHGWSIGHEVGWHIRFERRFTKDTRLLVVTEGILTAYLQTDPLLTDVATLILDEFHERSVHADLGLALAKQAWEARDDLRILIMSATLDTAPLSAFLHDCPVIDVPGALHPLALEYAPSQSMVQAIDEVLPRTPGNVLCFLPGAREIADAIAGAAAVAIRHGVTLMPLHGSLQAHEQDAVLQPSDRRRVIVATNIAETSLTVPGVSAVIDSGLQKVARYDPDRAVDSLTTERITLDSADQRAGRAARLGPGLARRLWDARDRLRPHREAEIHRIDLSSPVLAILAAAADLDSFAWFDRPAADRLASAIDLSARLGAIENGHITSVGRKMQQLPLPPRLARIFLESFGAIEACAACAWLAEPARLGGPAAATTSDILTVIDRWQDMPRRLKTVADHLGRLAAAAIKDQRVMHISETELRRALLTGYPDRVARRRAADKATLASGHGAIIGRETGVHDAEWLIALDVTAARGGANAEAIIRVASRIEPEWLSPTRSTVEQEIAESGALKARAVDWYDALVLAERPVGVNPEMASAVLAAAWLERGPDKQSARLMARLAFAGLDVDLNGSVSAAAQHARRVQDIVLTEEQLPWDARQRLAQQAPDSLKVPSGRQMSIEYGTDGTVSVSVKLQELFGLGDTPTIGPNKMPITFHLLAPNGRPVQTTRDLKSFWERTYPEVRKELRGRYPKHPWPDDPWNATPTHRTKRR